MPSGPPQRVSKPSTETPRDRVWISSILLVDKQRLIVRDIDLAVYLYMVREREALTLLDSVRVGKFRHEIFFSMPELGDAMIDKARRLELQFANSREALPFADAQRDVRRFMRRIDRERSSNGGAKQ